LSNDYCKILPEVFNNLIWVWDSVRRDLRCPIIVSIYNENQDQFFEANENKDIPLKLLIVHEESNPIFKLKNTKISTGLIRWDPHSWKRNERRRGWINWFDWYSYCKANSSLERFPWRWNSFSCWWSVSVCREHNSIPMEFIIQTLFKSLRLHYELFGFNSRSFITNK